MTFKATVAQYASHIALGTPTDPSNRAIRWMRRALVGLALTLLVTSWTLLWSLDTAWNPLFFWGTWLTAALLMYAASRYGYPGLLCHLFLAALSIPLWWWFELVNARVANWEYLSSHQSSTLLYTLMASIAFSTVIPALHAAWSLTISRLRPPPSSPPPGSQSRYAFQIALGVALQVAVLTYPTLFFPIVWISPFLILDGFVGYGGGRSLVSDLMAGQWRLAASVAFAGLLCGFLWEFWNFWAMPKWTYHIPVFDFARVFEMPLLGYGGYVPFAWSVYQLLHLKPLQRYLTSSAR